MVTFPVRAILPADNQSADFTVQLVPQHEGAGSYQFDAGTALGGGGDGNSSTYENFSSIEPIAGWSESEGNQSIEYLGYLARGSGDLGHGSDLILSVRPGVAENAPIGTVIGRFVADDPDTNTTVSYSMVDSNDSSHSHDLFHVESGVLSTRGTFDYETSAHHLVHIHATDERGGEPQKSRTIGVLERFSKILTGMASRINLMKIWMGTAFPPRRKLPTVLIPRDSNSMANQGAPIHLVQSIAQRYGKTCLPELWSGRFEATDADGDEPTYALVRGSGDSRANSFIFTISVVE